MLSEHRLVDLNILVGRTQDNWKLCDYYAGPGGAGEKVIIKCLQPITGRYVKIQKVDDTDYLTLCEVEVMGRAVVQGITCYAPNLKKAFILYFFQSVHHIYIYTSIISLKILYIDTPLKSRCSNMHAHLSNWFRFLNFGWHESASKSILCVWVQRRL